MAYVFQNITDGTLKGRATTSTDSYTLKGINSGIDNVANVVTEANKILAVFGKTMAADENVTMTITRESVDQD